MMELSILLLLVAFRHQIEEPDLDSGLLRVAMMTRQDIDPDALHGVLAAAIADDSIRDPVQLRPGALQCRWHLELTPGGVDRVLALLQEHGKTADELLAGAGTADN
jgi:hypothetical protein